MLFTEINILHRFVPSVSAVKVVGPQNQERLGMPNGHMTSPCVMTVPKALLKVGINHADKNFVYVQKHICHI